MREAIDETVDGRRLPAAPAHIQLNRSAVKDSLPKAAPKQIASLSDSAVKAVPKQVAKSLAFRAPPRPIPAKVSSSASVDGPDARVRRRSGYEEPTSRQQQARPGSSPKLLATEGMRSLPIASTRRRRESEPAEGRITESTSKHTSLNRLQEGHSGQSLSIDVSVKDCAFQTLDPSA